MPEPRVVILGGGHVGMTCALRLQSRLRPGEARITVIDAQSHMTYQPFLPEAAAGSLQPRHVVVPLREALRRCEVLTAGVTGVDNSRHEVTGARGDGETQEGEDDVLGGARGSGARALPVPGLAAQGAGAR